MATKYTEFKADCPKCGGYATVSVRGDYQRSSIDCSDCGHKETAQED